MYYVVSGIEGASFSLVRHKTDRAVANERMNDKRLPKEWKSRKRQSVLEGKVENCASKTGKFGPGRTPRHLAVGWLGAGADDAVHVLSCYCGFQGRREGGQRERESERERWAAITTIAGRPGRMTSDECKQTPLPKGRKTAGNQTKSVARSLPPDNHLGCLGSLLLRSNSCSFRL